MFDRNQGNLRESYARFEQAKDEQRNAEFNSSAELVKLYEVLVATGNEIKLLRTEILPAAQSAFDATNRGYELGKFGFIDVLDAQRTLFSNKSLHLRAVTSYQHLLADLAHITGAQFTEISPAENN